jgi:mono/diheme cytochrome c family protein
MDGASVLVQACAQCHNPLLDPTLSRARFRADLQGMDRAAKDRAIQRLQLPEDDPFAMPPARLRALSAEARARAIEALRR